MPQKPQRKRVLILGANGKLGKLLRRAWRLCPPEDICANWVSRTQTTGDEIIWAPGDPIERLGSADGVLALWGGAPESPGFPENNKELAVLAMQIARAAGAQIVIHCSSIAVYGTRPADPLSESNPCLANGAYGRSKMEMEQAINDRSRADPDGPAVCVLRLGNVVGADSLRNALIGRNPVILDRFLDGRGPIRSYIAAGDLARVFEAVLSCSGQRVPELLNVAAPEPIHMEQLVREAGKGFEWRPAPDGATQSVVMDTSRLMKFADDRIVCRTPKAMIEDWRQMTGAER